MTRLSLSSDDSQLYQPPIARCTLYSAKWRWLIVINGDMMGKETDYREKRGFYHDKKIPYGRYFPGGDAGNQFIRMWRRYENGRDKY